jgi:hypothetical protein
MATLEERAKEKILDWKPSMVLQTGRGFKPCRIVDMAEPASFGIAQTSHKLYCFEFSDGSTDWFLNPECYKIVSSTEQTLKWINGSF